MFFSQKSSIGIDIADRSVEVVELREEQGKIIVAGAGRSVLPPGAVERGMIKNPTMLASAIESACTTAKPAPIVPSHVIVAAPESQTFVRTAKLLASKAKEISEIVSEEVSKNIPLEARDAEFTYRMISKDEVLIAATNASILREWGQFFKNMNIEVVAFDLESQAIFRSVYAEAPKTPVVMCDWGSVSTLVSLFVGGVLVHSQVIPIGSDALTGALAKELGVSQVEAERQKTVIGFSDPQSKAFQVVRVHVDTILGELNTTLKYAKEKAGAAISEIIFTGGMSRMPGICEYASHHMPLTVRVGKAFFMTGMEQSGGDTLFYLEAAGLALRAWHADDIGFLPREEHRGWFGR